LYYIVYLTSFLCQHHANAITSLIFPSINSGALSYKNRVDLAIFQRTQTNMKILTIFAVSAEPVEEDR